MRWWRKDGGKNNGGGHDDDEERGDQQAAEIGFDCLQHPVHEVENSKGAGDENIGSRPDYEARGRSVVSCGKPASALRFCTYSCTRETTVAWLQVSGDTESGAFE